MATVQVLDCPGFQSGKLATLEDLCHNYVQERLQLLFHQHTFLAQQERYQQVGTLTGFTGLQGACMWKLLRPKNTQYHNKM